MKRRVKKMMDGGVSASPLSAFEQSQSPSYGGAGLGNMAPLVQIGSDMAGGGGGYPGGGGLLNIGMPGAAAPAPMRKGGAVKKMRSGGAVKKMRGGGSCGMKGGGKVRGGGCETKGKTRGRFV